MKHPSQKIRNGYTVMILTFIFISCLIFENHTGGTPNNDMWISAYLTAGKHNAGTLNSNRDEVITEKIQWNSFTHLHDFNFSIYARNKGLGGVMICGLAEDVMPDCSQPPLNAVENFRNN